MATKEQLLSLLETQKGTYLSGEEIAKHLDISRTAVWKAVKALQNDGYIIDAVRNKGYSLSVKTDVLTVQGIQKYLKPSCRQLHLNLLPTATSTNTLLREKAVEGAPDGFTIIANTQTNGRGRGGRFFYSPPETGIYISLLLRPHHYSSSQALKLTTMAAVAACRAIESVSDKQAQIKWVNDIYIDSRKVGGILTEASLSLEDGSLEYVIVGIGMNISPPKHGFPDDIKQIAGTIFSEAQTDGKNRLTAEFLNHFIACYKTPDQTGYVNEYRHRSLVIGKNIQVLFPDQRKSAFALDVNDACQLLVSYEDGVTECLSSGEISISIPQRDKS